LNHIVSMNARIFVSSHQVAHNSSSLFGSNSGRAGFGMT
jgi:hypothetical protein